VETPVGEKASPSGELEPEGRVIVLTIELVVVLITATAFEPVSVTYT
jgi:hypothetical protein